MHDMHNEGNSNSQEGDQIESEGIHHDNDENDTSEPMCSICLNSFHLGEKVSWARHNAECRHGKCYHHTFINKWKQFLSTLSAHSHAYPLSLPP